MIMFIFNDICNFIFISIIKKCFFLNHQLIFNGNFFFHLMVYSKPLSPLSTLIDLMLNAGAFVKHSANLHSFRVFIEYAESNRNLLSV